MTELLPSSSGVHETRSAASVASSSPRQEEPRWGTRWVRTANGTKWREVPLTRADLFDPQEGDVMVHGTLHGRVIRVTAVMLDHWFESQGRPDMAVFDDVKMIWDDPDLARIAPDIAVIPNVTDKLARRKSFRVAEEGTRPCCVIEVISESTRDFDYEDKPGIYRKAGVEECLFVDVLENPWKLSGKRLFPKTGRYRTIPLDKKGRLHARTLGLFFSIGAAGESLVVEDAVTGERLRNLAEEVVARQAAERRARQEAERARQEAERARQEASAREEAEARARKEAALRQEAEAKLARLEARLKAEGEDPHD